ncbi:MAG: hypothetical protein KBD37_10195, partial [Burkholderiales bacterium]|nr:hypothetical protein [Burkholderiales bacterium]
SEGIEYTGYFKNNLFNGMGILKKTVLEFNGYFENGEFIRGFLNHRIDNAIYSGGFYKLSPHGENIIWYRENFNEISIGKMNHGQKVGVWITVNVEEQIAAKYNYNKGSFSQKQQFDFIRAKQDIKRSEAQNDQALHKLLVDTNSMFILAGGTIEYADKSTLTVAKDTATNWLYCDEYGTQFKLVEPIALQGITITPNVIGCYRPEHATNDNKNVVILLDENYSDTNPLPINSRCRIYTMVSIVSGTYNEETGELSNTSIKFSNHNIYKGAINNLCKPHATRGELIYKNGDNYTGEFENGQNSRGLFKFWQGQYTYVGKFTNGLFEGNSILTCAVEVKSEEVRIDYAYLRPGDKLKGYFEKGKFIIGECIVSFPEKIKDFIHPQKVPTITICGRFKDFQPDGDEIIVYSPDKFNPTQILIGPMNKGQWSGRVTVININQNNKEAWEIPYAQGKINQHREKRKVQVIDAEQKINTAQKKLDEELALRIRNKS